MPAETTRHETRHDVATEGEAGRAGERGEPRVGVLVVAPIVLAALLVIRALRPNVDSTVIAVAVALVAVIVGVGFRQRWAGFALIVFPVALIVTPAAADLSFSLVAVDSDWWRWHAIASLVAGGMTIVVAVVVATGLRLGRRERFVASIGGALVGVAMIGLVQLVAPTETFGDDLTDAERAALPRVDLLNYTYVPLDLSVDADGVYRALLVNPSDLPHTVTVDELGLDLRVPAGREAVVEIDGRRLQPGVVEYYCSIGDHREIGMVGRLVVE